MASKEATARIKINRLLVEAGWRFFDDSAGSANIVLKTLRSSLLKRCETG
jgi:type I restriction enzyme R subunit